MISDKPEIKQFVDEVYAAAVQGSAMSAQMWQELIKSFQALESGAQAAARELRLFGKSFRRSLREMSRDQGEAGRWARKQLWDMRYRRRYAKGPR